ncbi:hypothetical protein EJ06DRAFT_560527 [Trichodelitschia bisporula]|uniref:Uncharacterized protein n=1 Tax=Trichodelitschia bisporula TaxID=703511 RepID=A0A6G1HI06_9PEZI|nr:hypothetical protein EJ06DRAFT_560527 [Trichodelitschia bisporula]
MASRIHRILKWLEDVPLHKSLEKVSGLQAATFNIGGLWYETPLPSPSEMMARHPIHSGPFGDIERHLQDISEEVYKLKFELSWAYERRNRATSAGEPSTMLKNLHEKCDFISAALNDLLALRQDLRSMLAHRSPKLRGPSLDLRYEHRPLEWRELERENDKND